MKQYLLTVYATDADYDGTSVSPDEMEKIYSDVDAFNNEVQAAGAWVFGGGLERASTATVAREQDGDILVTDGPYAETKEYIGGFWVIDAPDLDAALEWAGKATRACQGPVEVRPFQDGPEER